jgi:uncharacterized membrane protein
MDAAHIHLMLIHFPIVGFIFSLILLALGLYQKNESFVRAGLLITVMSGALAVPAYLTGESAEEVIKNIRSFPAFAVDEHEAAAFYAILFIGITTVIAGSGLFISIKKNRISKALMVLIVGLHIFTLTVIARTNYLGSKISHSEIGRE